MVSRAAGGRAVALVDVPGSERFLRTSHFALLSFAPHAAVLVVSALAAGSARILFFINEFLYLFNTFLYIRYLYKMIKIVYSIF